MTTTEPAARRDTFGGEADGAVPGQRQRNARLVLVVLLVGLGLWTIHNFLPALAWAAVLASTVAEPPQAATPETVARASRPPVSRRRCT